MKFCRKASDVGEGGLKTRLSSPLGSLGSSPKTPSFFAVSAGKSAGQRSTSVSACRCPDWPREPVPHHAATEH